MQLNVVESSGEASGQNVELSDAAFAVAFNEPLIHQVVNAYLAGSRVGSHKQKTRSEVNGGGAKPWRQKGTGRARAGTSRSPIWRGGGRAFAAVTRDYSQKVNKKMYRGALRSILSELIRQNRLVVLDRLEVNAPKTKEVVSLLNELSADNALILTEELDTNLALGARNLRNVLVDEVRSLDPVTLLRFDKIILTVGAIKKLEERLA